MPKIRANGIDIYYEIHGRGHPLVLISGLSYSRWQWHRMIPGLAEHFQVITFDNRGVGRTDRPDGPYSAPMLAADTAALLEALEVEKAAVMGHSMGGFVAQELALDRPDLVSHLILAATHYGGPHHVPITEEAMAVLSDTSGDPMERFRRGLAVSTAPGFAERNPDVIEAWMAYRTQNPIEPGPYQAQLAVGLALADEEAAYAHRLHRVQAPTLILFGQHDKVVPPANADLLAEQISDSAIEILPDAGHFFPLETPAAAVQAVVHFLQGRGAEGSEKED